MKDQLMIVNRDIELKEEFDVGGTLGCLIGCAGGCLVTGMSAAPIAVAVEVMD